MLIYSRVRVMKHFHQILSDQKFLLLHPRSADVSRSGRLINRLLLNNPVIGEEKVRSHHFTSDGTAAKNKNKKFTNSPEVQRRLWAGTTEITPPLILLQLTLDTDLYMKLRCLCGNFVTHNNNNNDNNNLCLLTVQDVCSETRTLKRY